MSDEVRITSAKVKLSQRVKDIWRYRELLVGLTRKELKVKYKNSILGFFWSMLNPALNLLVYYFVFQIVLKAGIPQFPLFLLSGLLVWNLFSSGLFGACASVVGNAGLIKKVSFPREILALASVGASVVHFFLQTVVLLVALAAFRHPPSLTYLPLLIPALIATILLTAAVGVFLAAINVSLRDTQHLLELALLAWFWACPIVYAYGFITTRLGKHIWLLRLYRLNPLTPIVLSFQRALYNRVSAPNHTLLLTNAPFTWYLYQLLVVIVVATILLCLSMMLFGRMEGNFAEEL
jgi:ABC-2 type transport system permease protein